MMMSPPLMLFQGLAEPGLVQRSRDSKLLQLELNWMTNWLQNWNCEVQIRIELNVQSAKNRKTRQKCRIVKTDLLQLDDKDRIELQNWNRIAELKWRDAKYEGEQNSSGRIEPQGLNIWEQIWSIDHSARQLPNTLWRIWNESCNCKQFNVNVCKRKLVLWRGSAKVKCREATCTWITKIGMKDNSLG